MFKGFTACDGVYFQQVEAGHVRVVATDDCKEPDIDGHNVVFDRTINDGIWGSAVLSMTAFGERPGDWQAWMDHHHGRRDLITCWSAKEEQCESKPKNS